LFYQVGFIRSFFFEGKNVFFIRDEPKIQSSRVHGTIKNRNIIVDQDTNNHCTHCERSLV